MKLTTQTIICGIIGDPVSHSLSPAMHNAGYEACGLNFAYLAFPVADLENAIRGIRALRIRGVSVTIPHKVAVMPYLDRIDARASKIGAVNTVLNTDGVLSGYNTDADGAMRAIEEKMSLFGKHAVVLGAGGASRAIIFGLTQRGCSVHILNRTEEHAKVLAAEFHCQYENISHVSTIAKTCDILINTTSVGMNTHDTRRLVPERALHKDLCVFDIVYNSEETQLMNDAKKAGCETISGRMMLLYQAAIQFEIFTGMPAPIEAMRNALFERSSYGR